MRYTITTRWLFSCALAFLIASTQTTAFAQNPLANMAPRSARSLNASGIPFAQLTPASREKLASVVARPSLHRKMPAQSVLCDPDMYVFMVRYPEVIVNIWQLMDVTTIDMKRTGDFNFWATDGSGTQANVELIYGTRDTHVFYAKGTYDGALFRRKINGRCVLVVKTGYEKAPAGRVKVTTNMDVYVTLDHAGAELIAKTLHPLVGRTADHNFSESIKFLGKLSEAAESNGRGVRDMGNRLTKIEPEVRREFNRLALEASQKILLRVDDLSRLESLGPDVPEPHFYRDQQVNDSAAARTAELPAAPSATNRGWKSMHLRR